MNQFIYRIKRIILTIFGDIKVFKWPMFGVYQPVTFKVKGHDTRAIIAVIQPGDVIMRSYCNYLDGYFIPKGESQCSHSGLYIGDNNIVHSIAEGSKFDDIIDFCRADRIVVLRPDKGQEWAIEHANKCVDSHVPYDFNFEPGSGKYYCHEFTASCYPELEIEQLSGKILGLISSPKAFLADSFYTNGHFTKIY
ncbi:MAG: YiiX/YebB-like N1pC/P60 family cysteine hydrolase [Mariprofundaceae bacterium]